MEIEAPLRRNSPGALPSRGDAENASPEDLGPDAEQHILDQCEMVEKAVRNLLKHVECPICLEPVKDPVSTPCHHAFCAMCLEKNLDSSQECPSCRAKISKRKLMPNETMGHLVQAALVVVSAVRKDSNNLILSPSSQLTQSQHRLMNSPEHLPPLNKRRSDPHARSNLLSSFVEEELISGCPLKVTHEHPHLHEPVPPSEERPMESEPIQNLNSVLPSTQEIFGDFGRRGSKPQRTYGAKHGKGVSVHNETPQPHSGTRKPLSSSSTAINTNEKAPTKEAPLQYRATPSPPGVIVQLMDSPEEEEKEKAESSENGGVIEKEKEEEKMNDDLHKIPRAAPLKATGEEEELLPILQSFEADDASLPSHKSVLTVKPKASFKTPVPSTAYSQKRNYPAIRTSSQGDKYSYSSQENSQLIRPRRNLPSSFEPFSKQTDPALTVTSLPKEKHAERQKVGSLPLVDPLPSFASVHDHAQPRNESPLGSRRKVKKTAQALEDDNASSRRSSPAPISPRDSPSLKNKRKRDSPLLSVRQVKIGGVPRVVTDDGFDLDDLQKALKLSREIEEREMRRRRKEELHGDQFEDRLIERAIESSLKQHPPSSAKSSNPELSKLGNKGRRTRGNAGEEPQSKKMSAQSKKIEGKVAHKSRSEPQGEEPNITKPPSRTTTPNLLCDDELEPSSQSSEDALLRPAPDHPLLLDHPPAPLNHLDGITSSIPAFQPSNSKTSNNGPEGSLGSVDLISLPSQNNNNNGSSVIQPPINLLEGMPLAPNPETSALKRPLPEASAEYNKKRSRSGRRERHDEAPLPVVENPALHLDPRPSNEPRHFKRPGAKGPESMTSVPEENPQLTNIPSSPPNAQPMKNKRSMGDLSEGGKSTLTTKTSANSSRDFDPEGFLPHSPVADELENNLPYDAEPAPVIQNPYPRYLLSSPSHPPSPSSCPSSPANSITLFVGDENQERQPDIVEPPPFISASVKKPEPSVYTKLSLSEEPIEMPVNTMETVASSPVTSPLKGVEGQTVPPRSPLKQSADAMSLVILGTTDIAVTKSFAERENKEEREMTFSAPLNELPNLTALPANYTLGSTYIDDSTHTSLPNDPVPLASPSKQRSLVPQACPLSFPSFETQDPEDHALITLPSHTSKPSHPSTPKHHSKQSNKHRDHKVSPPPQNIGPVILSVGPTFDPDALGSLDAAPDLGKSRLELSPSTPLNEGSRFMASPQPVVSPKLLPTEFVFLPTGLPPKYEKKLLTLARQFGAQVTYEFSPQVTHVLTEASTALVAMKRTIKLLQGIAGHKWVLSHAWIDASIEQNHFVDEEGYEIIGEGQYLDHGPRASRVAFLSELNMPSQSPLLLHGKSVVFFGEFPAVSIEALSFLVESNGGAVLQSSSPEEIAQLDTPPVIVIDDSDGDTPFTLNVQALVQQTGIIPVYLSWLFDSIIAYRLLDTESFLFFEEEIVSETPL